MGITGLILGVAALLVGVTFPSKVALTASLAASGAALLSAFFVLQFDFFRTFSKKRSTHETVNAVFMVVFFVFIVVLLNLIVRQYYFRYDYSTDKKYSLAPQSKTAAGLVREELHLIFFGVEGSKEYAKAAALFDSYRYLNKLIVYEMLDLDKVPLKAKEFGVSEYNTVVVKSSERTVLGRGADEQNITNLIIRATRRKMQHIRFLQGHREHSLDDKERSGYGIALKTLTAMGYRVEPLVLLQEKSVPVDTDLLIIAAPQTDLTPEEYGMLEHYRSPGGKFFVLVDSADQMKAFLESIHLKVIEFPVYDRQNAAGTDPSVPMVTKYYDNPITKDFNLNTIFPGVHDVRLETNAGEYEFQMIVRTSRYSWYEKNSNGKMDPGEEEGFNVVAGLVTHKQELIKAAVFGDSDFASNAYVSAGGNANLFANVVTWLCGEGALATVAPAKRDFIPMFVTEEQSNIVRSISVVGVPLFVFLAGFLVWYRRRSL